MGKLVNVVLWNGVTQTMPEEDAQAVVNQNAGRLETPGEETGRARAEQVLPENDGIAGKVVAGLSGALDTITLGAGGRLLKTASPELGQAVSEASETNPGSRVVGEVAGMLVPGAGDIGLGQNIGRGVEAVGGKLAGRVAEGAAFGVGGEIAHSNVTGDPLTIEGTVAGAGLGALLNVGVGAVADKLRGASAVAKADQVTETAIASDSKVVAAKGKLFDEPPPSWEDFRQSWDAKQKATAQYNAAAQKAADKYTDFYSTSKLGTAANKTQDVINDLQKERYASASATRAGNIQYIEGKPLAVMTGYNATGDATTILAPSQPPVSDEYVARMRDYQRRMSRVYKLQAGGYELDNTGKWVKSATVPADPQRALEELRAIQTDLKAEFPKAANGLGRAGDLPDMPPDQLPTADVTLPKSLRDFARKTPAKINILAQNLDGPSKDAFYQLASDLGVEADPNNVAAAVDNVHASLGDWMKAGDRLESIAAERSAAEAKRPWLVRMLNKAIRYSAARYFDVGGVLGAATRMAGGEVVGGALNGIEDSVLGAGLLQSKQGISRAIRDVVAKYGNGAAGGLERLGPITAYLARSFPSGQADNTTSDPRQLAARRANDIAAIQPIAADMAFSSLQPLMGSAGDVAFKLHQHLTNAVNHLAMVAPKDPGLNTTMFGSNWTPSWPDSIALAHRLEAVQNPIAAITRALAGGGHPAAAETLWATNPAIMQELALEFSSQADSLKVNYERGSAISRLLRTPVTGLQQPVVIAALQGIHLPQIQQVPSSNGAGLGSAAAPGRTPQPTGRPPAVQSSVAGSDVSGLISQA